MARFPFSLLLRTVLPCYLALLAACADHPSPENLPPLPQVHLEAVLPAIREHVEETLARARAQPLDAEMNGRLGMILATYDRFDSALAAYTRARGLAPRDYRWAYLQGHLLGFQGRAAEAVAALREALALQPEDPEVRIELANQLVAAGRAEEGRRLYEEVIARDPGRLRAHLGLGRMLAGAGELPEAARSLRAALAVDERVGEVHYALAQVLRRIGDEEAAVRHLAMYDRYRDRDARDHDPALATLGALHRGDRSHMVRARRLVAAGRREEAVAALSRAVEVNPNNDAAHTHLVWLYGFLGEAGKAEHHFRQALALNPNNAQLHFNWGHLLRKQGRYAEAEEALVRAVTLDPSQADALVQLGFVLEQRGQQDEALERYREALRLDPGQRNARYFLGRALARQGLYGEAIEQLRRCLEPEDGRAPIYLRTLASVYADQGDSGAARDALERALRLAQRIGNLSEVRLAEADLHRIAARAAAGSAQ